MFSEVAYALLKQAGWIESYRFDISGYCHLYTLAGCPPTVHVMDFLRRFGGIHVQNLQRRGYAPLTFDFDVSYLTRSRRPLEFLCDDYGYIFDYLNQLHAPIYMIGHAHGHHVILLMLPDGTVYGSYDELVWHLGNSGEEAIEALCDNRKWTELIQPD